jgi:hypothetical protein
MSDLIGHCQALLDSVRPYQILSGLTGHYQHLIRHRQIFLESWPYKTQLLLDTVRPYTKLCQILLDIVRPY